MPGLTAGRLALHHDGAQPLGGGVHGRSEPSGSAPDDAQVVERLQRGRAQPERRGEVERRRSAQRLAVGDEHEREVGGVAAGELQAAAAPRRRRRRRTSGRARGCGPGSS